MSLKPFFYSLLIDPLLKSQRRAVLKNIVPGESVLDVACGNGTLAFEMAEAGNSVIAIDLDPVMIQYASSRKKRGNPDILFKTSDASNLSSFADKQFKTAVTTMAVHQFDPLVAVKVLTEMKRVAQRIIIADYNIPLPSSLAGKIAAGIERMAGGDHYRNFRSYRNAGGLKHFASTAGLTVRSSEIRGKGVFEIAVLD